MEDEKKTIQESSSEASSGKWEPNNAAENSRNRLQTPPKTETCFPRNLYVILVPCLHK